MPLDDTHHPDRRSWVTSAQDPSSDFPIQNLPFGVFTASPASVPRIGVAIGDSVLDLRACSEAGLIQSIDARIALACSAPALNELMALGTEARTALRQTLSGWLQEGARERSALEPLLRPLSDVTMQLPAEIRDYTDFYASIFHATNVGSMLRPDEPLLPNYKYVPIGYHGRSSSIVPSGTPVRRPLGQSKRDTALEPSFGPSQRLDFELEIGALIGPGNLLGAPIPMARAESHVFGLCLVNDWSARDIQQWEYQPLGPFLGKSFATSLSPWIVTFDALEPFRAEAFTRPPDDPDPLPYLFAPDARARGGVDIRLEVFLTSERMRAEHMAPVSISRSTSKYLYWTVSQLVTHHTSNGCNLRPGDLLATGTVSGPTRQSRGCLLELTWRGTEPLALPTGEVRRFLEDGDEVVFRGWCERDGFRRLGFGECRGRVLPAPATT
jgi:fumarylacetoacetase